jgi:hypothetical protein
VVEQKEIAEQSGFNLYAHRNCTADINKTVNQIRVAGFLGMLGTKLYQLTHSNVSS